MAEAPHALYCRAYEENRESYLGFTDVTNGRFQVNAYGQDKGSPLVGFLRMLIGYMTARGLMSGALLPGLAPNKHSKQWQHPIGNVVPSLYAEVISHTLLTQSSTQSMNGKFRDYLKSLQDPHIFVLPSPGVDASGEPTVGSLLRIDHVVNGENVTAGSLFAMDKQVGTFDCVEASKQEPWQIRDELVVEYVRRTAPGELAISCKGAS